VRLATCGLCSQRRKLPHVCFHAVNAGVLKVCLDKKAPKKFSYIYICNVLRMVYKSSVMRTFNFYFITHVKSIDSRFQTRYKPGFSTVHKPEFTDFKNGLDTRILGNPISIRYAKRSPSHYVTLFDKKSLIT